jgi:hypothetical protein
MAGQKVSALALGMHYIHRVPAGPQTQNDVGGTPVPKKTLKKGKNLKGTKTLDRPTIKIPVENPLISG